MQTYILIMLAIKDAASYMMLHAKIYIHEDDMTIGILEGIEFTKSPKHD